MELLRITRQIHCKAVKQRATLIHRQYNRDWGTSYSRPPIDPYLISPLLQNPGGATAAERGIVGPYAGNEMGRRCFFVKKWTFPQRRVHYVQYQYFLYFTFYLFGGGVHTHPTYPRLRACHCLRCMCENNQSVACWSGARAWPWYLAWIIAVQELFCR